MSASPPRHQMQHNGMSEVGRSHNREVEHVPAYPHSNRWVGVGGTCSDKRASLAKFVGAKVTIMIVQDPFDWLSVSETRASQRQALDNLAKHNEAVEKYAASVLSHCRSTTCSVDRNDGKLTQARKPIERGQRVKQRGSLLFRQSDARTIEKLF